MKLAHAQRAPMRQVQVLPLDLAEIATLPEAAATAKSFFGEVGDSDNLVLASVCFFFLWLLWYAIARLVTSG